MPPDDDYGSAEEIERAYKKRLAAADDEELPALKLELAEAKATFYERRAQQTELRAAKIAALAQYPLAKDFEDMISGGSAEEIEAAAKKIHERMQAAGIRQKEEVLQTAAVGAYGAPAGGGGAPPPTQPDPNVERTKMIQQKLRDGERLTSRESEWFQRFWGGEMMAETIRQHGKVPWMSQKPEPPKLD